MTERPALNSSPTELGGEPQPGVNGPKPDGSDETPTRRPGPWGPSASLGLTLVIVLGMGGAQEAAARTLQAHWMTFRSLFGSRAETPSASHLTSAEILAGAFAASGVVWLLALARRYPARDYLAIKLPTRNQTALAVIGLAVFIVVNYSISWVLAQPLEPPAVVDIYRTGAHALFFVASVVGAPVGEELLFRGFLYEGLANSKFGPLVAIFVTAIGWGALHLAFGIYAAAGIVILGLYLGAIRQYTRSVPLAILLHSLNNAVGLGVISYLAQR